MTILELNDDQVIRTELGMSIEQRHSLREGRGEAGPRNLTLFLNQFKAWRNPRPFKTILLSIKKELARKKI
jgi:hypothetical protein